MIPFIICAIVVVIVLLWAVATTNSFKRSQIKIDEAASGIEVALTKRWDMLTKLLDVTKAYAKHEVDVLSKVIQLRKGMSIGELQTVSDSMGDMAKQLSIVAEAYPELRSSDNFKQLQLGIMDAEEHLQASRRLYNSNVSMYNTAIAMFPDSVIAGMMKLTARAFFEAEPQKKRDVAMDFKV